MKIAVMQPYLFPYIGYFQLMNAVDTFVIYDDVNFINKGWINRNKILVNGKEHLFSIPLKGANQNRLIKDIEVDDSSHWRERFMKTIQINYKKAPFINDVLPLISRIIFSAEKNISKLILESFCILGNYLGINTNFVVSSQKYKDNIYRGEDRILAICRNENADSYMNLIGGIDLYSREKFSANGINLIFVKSKDIHYKQFNNQFIPFLSIIDVLVFNSVDRVKNYLNEYQLL